VGADDFFVGFLEVAMAPDEMLTEIVVPACGDAGWSFQKFNRRAQDWATVGVALVHSRGSGPTGIGLVNMSSSPMRAVAATEALRSGASPAEVGAVADDGTEPADDIAASAAYRRHLARVLVERAAGEASG
jgi:carbon-monoxide dehydrogenase medium subunit